MPKECLTSPDHLPQAKASECQVNPGITPRKTKGRLKQEFLMFLLTLLCNFDDLITLSWGEEERAHDISRGNQPTSDME